MLPCNLNWNNISLPGFLEFLQMVNCTKSERSQNNIFICFRITPNRWNAEISFEKYTLKARQKYFPKFDNKFHKMCQVLYPFAIYFTILANFQTMTFLSKRIKKEQVKWKKKQKQIVIERQIPKSLNKAHCTLQTSKVDYLYNVVMILAHLSFASSAILLRRGN